MKLNRNLSLVIGLVFLASVASGTIVNDTVPAWRGQANTTYQAWGFDTSANPAVLETGWDNGYGTPTLRVDGVDTTPPITATFWKSLDNGHQGVWRLYGESFVEIYIPNNPVQNPSKTIQLQVTYYASGDTGADPELYVMASPTETFLSIEQVSKVLVDEDNYYHAIWEIVIEPNPNEEWIYLTPRDCTIYIDEVIVDTICIPEPATIALLSLGSIGFVLRKRK